MNEGRGKEYHIVDDSGNVEAELVDVTVEEDISSSADLDQVEGAHPVH